MTANHTIIHRAGLVTGTVVLAALLSACGGSHVRSASRGLSDHGAEKAQARADARADKAAIRAEQAVARAPQSAAARTTLGRAYLAAGRFDSAATALNDAMTLGDNSGQTALSLALARIGQGRFQDASALLDDWRDEIPASDLGLALALSGETSRGVAVLADALRSGTSTPKLRQNLAYAYALDGRWQESRLMAAQDVPADQLERRMAIWALSMLPDRNGERVAGLLGAPLRRDPGQPAALALRADPAQEQLAVETAAPAPAQQTPVPQTASAELPVPTVSVVAANLAAQTPAEPAPAARPTVAQVFGQTASAPAPVQTAASRPARRAVLAAVAVRAATGGTHYVQLGSFSSQQGARRAWGIYTHQNHALTGYRMTITSAQVRGRTMWRVAAGGLGGRLAANGLCSSVKARGGACFAYAAPLKAAPAPGVPARAPAGPVMARR